MWLSQLRTSETPQSAVRSQMKRNNTALITHCLFVCFEESQSPKFTALINNITRCPHTHHLTLRTVRLMFWSDEFSPDGSHNKSRRGDPFLREASFVTRLRCHERWRLPCELNDSLRKLGQEIQLGMSKPLLSEWATAVGFQHLLGCSSDHQMFSVGL